MIWTPNTEVLFATLNFRIFLGGTIDNGDSLNWQKGMAEYLNNLGAEVYNPRREQWDESAGADEVYKQVQWERLCQQSVDLNFYYLEPSSKSPITLMEMGEYKDKPMLVCTNRDFWRYHNVKSFCDYYKIPLVGNLDEARLILKMKIEKVL